MTRRSITFCPESFSQRIPESFMRWVKKRTHKKRVTSVTPPAAAHHLACCLHQRCRQELSSHASHSSCLPPRTGGRDGQDGSHLGVWSAGNRKQEAETEIRVSDSGPADVGSSSGRRTLAPLDPAPQGTSRQPLGRHASTGMACLLAGRNYGHAEAQVVVAAARLAPATARRPAVRRRVVPATAPEHAEGARFSTRRIFGTVG
jgi:hypothetical protein